MKTAAILVVTLICAIVMSGCVLYPAGGPHGGGAAVIAPVVVGPGPGPVRGRHHVHGRRGVRPGAPAVIVIP
ncbi:MAG: hypothetical protein QGI24_05800 [Kiritimatiellia bacterium]|jgi:hypothetical protein|nr:hypothetical protein [Kiritimatiellia bacterium]MDP6848283.1 hypothetical protein [Kiritimatiellia bacterium]